jgi:hypothetical protein
MASTCASIKIQKSGPFKGGTRVWSNRYHFTGGTPADGTHWTTLSDAIVTAEKACTSSLYTIVGSVGYASGSEVPVFSKVYSTAGTFGAAGSDHTTPLECCALLRWSTAARSTKNHPIYCFSYMHGAFYDSTAGYFEKLAADLKTALQTYAAAWVSGFSDGSITAVRSSPQSHTATGYIVEEYLTHRDFPFTRSV